MELSYYERKHVQAMLKQERFVSETFNDFCRAVSVDLQRWTDYGNENVWNRNAAIEKAIEKELSRLHDRLASNIKANESQALKTSESKNEMLLTSWIQHLAVKSIIKEGLFSRNREATASFQKRIDKGVGISKQIWDVTEDTKAQLEFYLRSGLATGRSASVISQDIRQLLNEPDKRFHRIRNDEGKLVESQPMKEYHPGMGKYRSAKMNAQRIAVTETNMAYRRADCERWKSLDIICGYEVQRSSNNKGPCKICDAMAGKYPKDFMWTGWHPFCICYATPIVLPANLMVDYFDTGKVPANLLIDDIPDSAREYVSNMGGESTPYFIQDNPSFFEK